MSLHHHHRSLRSGSSRSSDAGENGEEEDDVVDHVGDDVPNSAGIGSAVGSAVGGGGEECSSMDISSGPGEEGLGGGGGSGSEHMADVHHDNGGDHHHNRDGSHHHHVEHPPSGPHVDRGDEYRRISRCASVVTSVVSLDADAAGEASDPDRDVKQAVERVREETAKELNDDDDESAEEAAGDEKAGAVAVATAAVEPSSAVMQSEEGEEKKEKDAADDPEPPLSREAAAAADVAAASEARSSSRSVITIRMSAEEERLMDVMIAAAESYERGEIQIDESKFRNAANSNGKGNVGGACSPIPEDGGQVSRAQTKPKIAIRVAGGWVRDKILDLHSHDVDVSLDCMSGVQFATIVKEYLLKLERDDDGAIPHRPAVRHSKIGVICANPSQSKHLETATMKIFNIEVDFVNLRAEEVYENDSRIPTASTRQFGSPLEDALRRDFTINSLFYNVRTKQVEDWTERGIDDLLIRRLVVTPLDPHITFRNDPLRVLRAIRFAVRYNMDLADDIVSAATSPAVHGALHRKVSRERVGKEVEGMLSGRGARPDRALDLINGLRLAGSVFVFPPGGGGDDDASSAVVSGTVMGLRYDGGGPEDDLARARARGWEEATALMRTLPRALESHRDELHYEETLECDEDGGAIIGGVYHRPPTAMAGAGARPDGASHDAGGIMSGDDIISPPAPLSARKRLQSYSMFASVDVRILHLAAFLLPFRDLTFPDKKGKIHVVPSHMIREGLKCKNRDTAAMEKLMEHVGGMRELMRGLKERQRLAAEQQQQQQQHVGDDGHHHASGHDFHDDAAATMPPPRLCRLEAGLLLRQLKELWVTCLLLATVIEMREAETSSVSASSSGDGDGGAASGGGGGGATAAFDNAEEAVRISRDLYRSIRLQGLDGVWKTRPLLNGRDIMAALDLPKGPVVSVYVEEQIKWMLLNPDGTRDECERHLRTTKRKREMEEEHHRRRHHGEVRDEQNEVFVGVSDGAGHHSSSSPVVAATLSGTEAMEERHFSKRMHVERLDSLPDL